MGRIVHATKWLYGCIAVLSLGVAAAQSTELAKRVDDAVAGIRSGRNVADARETLDDVLDGPAFNQLDRARRNSALSSAAVAATAARDHARAHELALRLVELDSAAPRSWLLRFYSALDAGYINDALASLTRIVEQWPEEAARIPALRLYQVVSAANRLPSSDAKLRLLSGLFEMRWRSPFAGEPSDLWRELALVLVERGELSEARGVVARITGPGVLVRIRADRRFDSLTTTSPELFDVPAASAREIARLEAEVSAAPDLIEPIVYLANALEANNRCDDALALIDKAISRASGSTAEERPFRDTGRYLTWLLDHRARVLECLGRWDEALQRRIRAAQLTESGGSNTSQALNLAHALADRERPTDALEVLESVGPMSGYGKTVEQSARLKVYLQLGNDQGVQTALAYLSEHRDDSLPNYQWALIKVGQLDAAAALLIRRLEDASTRVDALEDLQRYGAQRKPVNETDDELLGRGDVRAAIDRVGRIESYPYLRWSGWE